MPPNPALAAKSADVRLRVEPALKDEVVRILADSGLELSMAIRIFFRQVVVHRGLPFDVRQPNAATLVAMKEARAIAKPRYGSAKALFDGLEKGSAQTPRRASATKRSHAGIPKRLAKAPT